jgi:hypothetical protein
MAPTRDLSRERVGDLRRGHDNETCSLPGPTAIGPSTQAVGMLTIRLLGEFEVSRDAETAALPPSKRRRALLAYLAATGRPSPAREPVRARDGRASDRDGRAAPASHRDGLDRGLGPAVGQAEVQGRRGSVAGIFRA